MSTEFFNDQWRIPSNENQNKVSNYSVSFDGTNQNINLGTDFPYPSTVTDKWSFSCWVKLNSTSSGGYIFSTYNGTNGIIVSLRGGADLGMLQATIRGDTASNYSAVKTNNSLGQNEWRHVVVTYNGNSSSPYTAFSIYFNSNPQGLSPFGASTQSGSVINSSNKYIGQFTGGNYLTDCDLDQVTFFDYELSQDQVTQLGAEGYAFNFNGSTQAIDCGAGSRFDIDQITISGWAKLDSSITSTLVIAGIRNANQGSICYHLQNQGTSSKFRFVIRQEDDTYVDAIADDIHQYNTWYHVVGVADGSNVKLYVNGELQTNVNSYDGTIKSPNQNFNIGRQPSSPLYYWDGELSNISVFNTGLTGPQVTTLYNSGKPLADMSSFTSLQGWWKLDETATFNSNWSIPDDSTNSNTGTSVGMNASNLVASNINGELIANPMITSPKPIVYYQLGDQSVSTGPTSDYLVPNNSLSDYVFDFDGSSSRIKVQDASNEFGFSNNSFSLSAWVFIDSNTTQNGLIAKRNIGTAAANKMWYFEINTSSQLRFLWYNTVGGSANASSTDTVPLNTWTHVVVTSDGTGANGLNFYINGSVDSGGSKTGPSSASSIQQTGTPLWVGARGGNSSAQYTSGKLSNVSIFNTALTGPQVETIYNNGAPNNISSLSPVAWYKLNAADTFDGSNWTINDYGSGGNDGTSSGMDSSNLVVSDLQQTSGYSPYALDFDGINDYLNCGDSNTFSFGNGSTDSPFSISAWVNMTDATQFRIANKFDSTSNGEYIFTVGGSDQLLFQLYDNSENAYIGKKSNTVLTSYQGQWIHLVGTYDGTSSLSGIKLYLNSSKVDDTNNNSGTYVAMENTTEPFLIGRQKSHSGSVSYSNGKISNAAIFNTELSSTQVTEIYNQGRPSNLHNFSGTAPVSWWQIGSNSSYNSGAWTCLDEIGSNNAVSAGSMTNSDIVDGPGYSASGLGTSSIDIKGDAPYSTANGLSENMDVLDRTTDVPS